MIDFLSSLSPKIISNILFTAGITILTLVFYRNISK